MSKPRDVVNCRRYEMVDNEKQQCYVVVSGDSVGPQEVFFSYANDNDHDLKNKFSNVTCMTRFISKFMCYGGPLSETLHQLERSSRSKNDVSDIIRQCLLRFSNTLESLHTNGPQNWKHIITGRECILPKGVLAGYGWQEVNV